MYMYLKLIIFNFFCSHQFHHWHVNFLKVRFIYFYMYHQVKKKNLQILKTWERIWKKILRWNLDQAKMHDQKQQVDH